MTNNNMVTDKMVEAAAQVLADRFNDALGWKRGSIEACPNADGQPGGLTGFLDDARAALSAALEQEQEAVGWDGGGIDMGDIPTVHVDFYTSDGLVIGTTPAKIIETSKNDDGSLTVKIDHWPSADGLSELLTRCIGFEPQLDCELKAYLSDAGNRPTKHVISDAGDLIEEVANLPTVNGQTIGHRLHAEEISSIIEFLSTLLEGGR